MSPELKAAPKVEHKAGMVRVRCPWRGSAIVWANIGRKRGAVCTACGQTGHELAEDRQR